MNQQTALQLLINVAHLAQKQGIFSLEDAVKVKEAIDIFTTPKTESDYTISEKGTSADHPEPKAKK